jgi:cyanobactin maturation PatA/PatG family protease
MGERKREEAEHSATALAGDPRILVAVLDGPVDVSHPSLSGADLTVQPTLATVGAETGPGAMGHGTHVASIIFGRGAVAGIAPACRGLIVPIFSGEQPTCSQLDLARAILTAADHGAHIINISGGQPAASPHPEPMLHEAIARCADRNVLIVAAAGNDGCDCLHLPAAADTVLAVGAMDSTGKPLASSNFGSSYQRQGLLAPGASIDGAAPGGGKSKRSGTSYAAPYVAAHAALLLGLQLALGRAANPHAVRQALLSTADPCPDSTGPDCIRFLAGTMNFAKAAAAIAAQTPAASEKEKGGDAMTNFEWVRPLEAEESGQAIELPAAHIHPTSAADAVRPSDDTQADASDARGAVTHSIAPSDCGCGCGGKKADAGKDGDCGCGCGGHGKNSGGAARKPQLVYALGKLGIDFGTEARRDSLLQAMSMMPGEGPTAGDVLLRLLDYFETAPYDAASVIWTLNLDATPIYSINPVGAYAAQAYERMRAALRAQIAEGADLISVPGVIGGSLRLQSGQTVPAIIPGMRGIYSWATKPLVEHALGAAPTAKAALETYTRQASGLSNYLDRVYYDLRNLGLTGEERALNYSATNAVQVASVVRSATLEALDLDRIAVKRSPVCRPDSECYDVELSFFNPGNTNVANRVFRFTVDVSDVIPVTIGPVRNWTRRV